MRVSFTNVKVWALEMSSVETVRSDAELIDMIRTVAETDMTRGQDGRIPENKRRSATTLVIAPLSDPRPPLTHTMRIPHGFKVVGVEKGVLYPGKRGAPYMCAIRREDGGVDSCEKRQYFKYMRSLAGQCESGALNCEGVRFLADRKLVFNPTTNKARRYAGAVVPKSAAEGIAEEEVREKFTDTKRILLAESVKKTRQDDQNPLHLALRRMARAGDMRAAEQLKRAHQEAEGALSPAFVRPAVVRRRMSDRAYALRPLTEEEERRLAMIRKHLEAIGIAARTPTPWGDTR